MVSVGTTSLTQTDYESGNFEMVVWEEEGKQLVHYFSNFSPSGPFWQRSDVISTQATGPGSFIQSDYKEGVNGNFEVAVLEGNQLVHHFRNNASGAVWKRLEVISQQATGPGSLIQSDFRPSGHGSFEVVVLEEGNQLVHYSSITGSWKRGKVISQQAAGPGSLIQRPGGHGDFEVVVLEEGNQLVHYSLDHSNLTGPWQGGDIISRLATGPGSLIQSDYGENLEVVVLEGNQLVHYSLDHSHGSWQRRKVISRLATGSGSLIQSHFGPGGHGNFEVVFSEQELVIHHWRDNADPSSPWRIGQVIAA